MKGPSVSHIQQYLACQSSSVRFIGGIVFYSFACVCVCVLVFFYFVVLEIEPGYSLWALFFFIFETIVHKGGLWEPGIFKDLLSTTPAHAPCCHRNIWFPHLHLHKKWGNQRSLTQRRRSLQRTRNSGSVQKEEVRSEVMGGKHLFMMLGMQGTDVKPQDTFHNRGNFTKFSKAGPRICS